MQLLQNWYVIKTNVMAYQNISGCQMSNSISNAIRPITKSLVGCDVIDHNAMDLSDLVIKTITLEVEDKVPIIYGTWIHLELRVLYRQGLHRCR